MNEGTRSSATVLDRPLLWLQACAQDVEINLLDCLILFVCFHTLQLVVSYLTVHDAGDGERLDRLQEQRNLWS